MKKKNGAYIQTIPFYVFDCNVHIIVTENPNEYIDKSGLRVWTGDDPDHDYMKYCDGLCLWVRNSDYYIIVPPEVSLNVAVHETCHAINRIFGSRNQKADFKNDEVYCYYVGWLAQKVINHVSEAHKIITNRPSIPQEVKSAETINT